MITEEMVVDMYNEIISSVCRKIKYDISGRFKYTLNTVKFNKLDYTLNTVKFNKLDNEYRDFTVISISYNDTYLSMINIPVDVDMERYNSWRLPEELIYVLVHRKFVIIKCELRKKL